MGGKGKAPPPIDPGKSQLEYIEGITDPVLQEKILGAEERGRPRYAALELKDIQTFAEGLRDPVTGEVTTPGVLDLLENQSQRAFELQQAQLQDQRAADVGALGEFAPQVVEAYRAADPYSTELADAASQQALSLFGEATGPLSPERRRLAEQAARSGSLARGRIGDQSSIAAELLGREQFKSGLRAEARQAGAGAFGMQRQMAGDLGMTILGRPSSAIQLGSQTLGQATNLAGQPIGPQLFDPNVGINMALQQRGQDMELAGANAQARGAIIGGIAGGLGTAFGKCWVAREVYGEYNPKWIKFREWLTNEAPRWFDKLYVNYGERFAKFISNKPRLKSIIRNWMDTRIK
jgi:hypothetical protein|tara:strand:- start:614 stop:1663 length:1050 start_codon:yes stop_codon:yes gene_type:complete